MMRYLPLTETDRRDMLRTIGAPDVDALFRDVPAAVYLKQPVDLPHHASEMAVERRLRAMAARNHAAGDGPFFLGAGAYRHHVPASVDHLIQRGEFMTAYTPYQPEMAQGTLQYLYEFQTQVAMLSGMEVANASMYDGASAAAEAVLMANRVTKRKRAVLSGNLHPHYAETIETHARFLGFDVVRAPWSPDGREDLAGLIDDATSCVVAQTPGFFGEILDLTSLGEAAHAKGALLVAVTTEAMAWGLIRSPGGMGADIVAAEGQSIGNGLNFGGPYVGLFATREKFIRQMPGRLAGETVDVDGRRGWVLTLNTREQHIRRDKATSNICTNSGLCALAFTIHLSLLGEEGLVKLARLNHARAVQTAEALEAIGLKIVSTSFFNEFTVRLPKPAAGVVEELAAQGILAGVPVSRLIPDAPELADLMLVAATELTEESDIAALAAGLREALA